MLDPTTSADESPGWLASTDDALRKLTQLSPGWDSYRARPTSTRAAAVARELLRRTMQDETPVPSIVPMSQGGIQLEWHLRGMNIEVTVPPTGSPVEVWCEDLQSGEEGDFAIDGDIDSLREVLAELTSRG